MPRKKVPNGYIHKSMIGGCLNPPTGMYQSGYQTGGSSLGGFAVLPAIAAAYAGLKAVQPFAKSKKALEENVSKEKQKSKFYTIPHKIASIGASLGFGEGSNIIGKYPFHPTAWQPVLANTTPKPKKKGTGKKKVAKKTKPKTKK